MSTLAKTRSAPVWLTQRDMAILVMVYTYGGVTVEHVHRRLFVGRGPRHCYRRIAQLTRLGYLDSVRLPSSSGIGSGKVFLTVGRQARPILVRMLGLYRSELKRSRLSSPFCIAHHLATCDFRVSLALACEESSLFSLQEWIPERELKNTPIRSRDSGGGRELAIIPDGAFTLRLADGSVQTFLLELDMGTVAPRRLKAKLRIYLGASRGQRLPVLFVVCDDRRRAAIERWALAEAQALRADATIFWLATKSAIGEATILSEPIWQIVGGPESAALESLALQVPARQGAPTNHE
jgi:hypothetical protein